MNLLPLIDNIHIKGMFFQIFDIGSRFDFITKKTGNSLLFFSRHLFFIL